MSESIFNGVWRHFAIIIDSGGGGFFVFLDSVDIGRTWERWCLNAKIAWDISSGAFAWIDSAIYIRLILNGKKIKQIR